MKKNTSKTKIISILLSLIFVMGLILSGCGGPENLEEMAKNDENFKSQIEMLKTSGMAIDIKENTIIYTYTYNQVVDETQLPQVKTQIESSMNSMSSAIDTMKGQITEDTGIEDVTIKFVYNDSNGTELYSVEY